MIHFIFGLLTFGLVISMELFDQFFSWKCSFFLVPSTRDLKIWLDFTITGFYWVFKDVNGWFVDATVMIVEKGLPGF